MRYLVMISMMLLSPMGYANCLGNVDEYITSTTLVSSHVVTTQVTGKLLERDERPQNELLNKESEVVQVAAQDDVCFYDKATQSLVLNYPINVYQLDESHKQVLEQYLSLVGDKSKIFIEGHADSLGSESYNKALSSRRAGQVASYLKEDLRQGTRIVEYAYGESAPICKVADNKATGCNRRVVITVKS
ncbi:OmpA-like domain-containing protein [Vibrio chagasii]|uniref:OmpA family protein n=1 Tax=Vibrio chagasii TaxID=170679 RepID=UPI001EFC8E48|nr:OmpA family protein [Vibrio chagasii]MCG9561361.1 OmpA family protein [Vibrio chagasii]CAH7013613.1 OmpA-like domain-containing protein [Vibrio chagasii]CAH7363435.1 OmpA-like domain-containing protein [Vibrio chagasii]CAH7390178.1 OmpA-like domain-containing protein [Vibrio chagasii]